VFLFFLKIEFFLPKDLVNSLFIILLSGFICVLKVFILLKILIGVDFKALIVGFLLSLYFSKESSGFVAFSIIFSSSFKISISFSLLIISLKFF